MKKILLSFICLISISFAEMIPYKDLISGKYKYSENCAFYLDNNESNPKIKQMINIYYKEELVKEPTIHKVKKQYFEFLISEQLYRALMRYPDYQEFLKRPTPDIYKQIDSYDYGLLIDIKYASKIFRDVKMAEYYYKDNSNFEQGIMITQFWLNQEPKKLELRGFHYRADYIDELFIPATK